MQPTIQYESFPTLPKNNKTQVMKKKKNTVKTTPNHKMLKVSKNLGLRSPTINRRNPFPTKEKEQSSDGEIRGGISPIWKMARLKGLWREERWYLAWVMTELTGRLERLWQQMGARCSICRPEMEKSDTERENEERRGNRVCRCPWCLVKREDERGLLRDGERRDSYRWRELK